jgi:hypothetical protein
MGYTEKNQFLSSKASSTLTEMEKLINSSNKVTYKGTEVYQSSTSKRKGEKWSSEKLG